jgi:hypothetical protein
MTVALLGTFFFISGRLDAGEWMPEAFVVAGLLALFPILFLVGLIALSKRATSQHSKAVIRIMYGIIAMAVVPMLKVVARGIQHTTHDPNAAGIIMGLAYSAYAMFVMALITMFSGLATILREHASE